MDEYTPKPKRDFKMPVAQLWFRLEGEELREATRPLPVSPRERELVLKGKRKGRRKSEELL